MVGLIVAAVSGIFGLVATMAARSSSDPEGPGPSAGGSTTPAPSVEGDVPSWLIGRWQGTITEPNALGPADYPMVVTYRQGSVGDVVGSSEYPTLGCAGDHRLLLLGSDSSVQLEERLRLGNELQCANGVPLVIQMASSSTIDVMFYSPGSQPEGAPVASGQLQRE